MVLFGFVKNASPETSKLTLNLDLLDLVTILNILFSFLFKELEECLSLNLILKTASADPGITLSA